jgi:hypothetical protein
MRFLRRMFATQVIVICGSEVRCVKGRVGSLVLAEVAATSRASGVEDGEIWIDEDDRIRFSGEISPQVHQRLRNVIVSHLPRG